MLRHVLGTALGGLVIAVMFAGCAGAVAKPAACKTSDDGALMADRTIKINSLSGCTITTAIGTEIDYDFVSPIRDVRISWVPSGTSKTDAGQSTTLTVSGTVTGPPQTKTVRVWYGTKSLLFTWKVERSEPAATGRHMCVSC